MSDAAFERMQALAEGVIISREEALIVEPDSRAFYALAQKYGRRTDVAFFWIFEQTYGGTAWPSYVQQLTDVTGCTDLPRANSWHYIDGGGLSARSTRRTTSRRSARK